MPVDILRMRWGRRVDILTCESSAPSALSFSPWFIDIWLWAGRLPLPVSQGRFLDHCESTAEVLLIRISLRKSSMPNSRMYAIISPVAGQTAGRQEGQGSKVMNTEDQ
jgi:hypothetical protein